MATLPGMDRRAMLEREPEVTTNTTCNLTLHCLNCLGTDRHNIVEIPEPNSNYPFPYERSGMWNSTEVLYWFNVDGGSTSTEVALAFATAGYYHCFTGCTESVDSKDELNNLLNNAPASFRGALVRFREPAVYHYICSRNNNFTNRSQKGTITIRSP